MQHAVVSRAEWIEARRALLAKEKAFTRAYDAFAAEQRALPWVKLERDYVFDGPDGPVTLSELFAGRSQLFLKSFMMEPGQIAQCVGCSLEVDHLEGLLEHLNNRDITYAVVARAPIAEIETVRRRMGWRFPWVSSFNAPDWNADLHVAFQPAENPGAGESVFYKDEDGQVFHTYSTYRRGGEAFLGIYRFIDLMPKGRDETGYGALNDWARPRNMYGQGGFVEANGRFHAETCGCDKH